jgi:hypothetical protein
MVSEVLRSLSPLMKLNRIIAVLCGMNALPHAAIVFPQPFGQAVKTVPSHFPTRDAVLQLFKACAELGQQAPGAPFPSGSLVVGDEQFTHALSAKSLKAGRWTCSIPNSSGG